MSATAGKNIANGQLDKGGNCMFVLVSVYLSSSFVGSSFVEKR